MDIIGFLDFSQFDPLSFFYSSHSSYLEVVDLHEGFVRVEGMFNCGGAGLTDLTGVLHVRPAERKIDQTRTHRDKVTGRKMGKCRGSCSYPIIVRGALHTLFRLFHSYRTFSCRKTTFPIGSRIQCQQH